MLIMNRPAVPTSLFIEFSEQARFTGWVWRVIYKKADLALRRVNQLSCTTESGTLQPSKMIWGQSTRHGKNRRKRDNK